MSTAGEREIITKIKFPSQECPPNAKIIEMRLFILFGRLCTVLKYSVGLALLLVS